MKGKVFFEKLDAVNIKVSFYLSGRRWDMREQIVKNCLKRKKARLVAAPHSLRETRY